MLLMPPVKSPDEDNCEPAVFALVLVAALVVLDGDDEEASNLPEELFAGAAD